jgi:hypothetical protein
MIITTFTSIIGTALVACVGLRLRLIGFLTLVFSNTLWVLTVTDINFLVLFGTYLCLAMYGTLDLFHNYTWDEIWYGDGYVE